jgi:hypothetical protein
MKTQEQRITDAAAALAETLNRSVDEQRTYTGLAAKVLEAADRETPAWPTDDSIDAYTDVRGFSREQNEASRVLYRAGLRAAMLADPIIKAAIAYRDVTDNGRPTGSFARDKVEARLAVRRVVDEAGL